MALLWLLASGSLSLCETPGLYCIASRYVDDPPELCTKASASYSSIFNQGVVILYGSFVAKDTGSHIFQIRSDYSSALSDGASANFVFDDDSLPAQSGTWTYTASLIKDGRYYYYSRTSGRHHSQELELSVCVPSGISFFTIDSTYSDQCEERGCRVLSYTRLHECGPSPSNSRSISVSESPNRSPNESPSISVSESPSRSSSASPRATASFHLSESGHFGRTRSISASGAVRPSFALARSLGFLASLAVPTFRPAASSQFLPSLRRPSPRDPRVPAACPQSRGWRCNPAILTLFLASLVSRA
jgi:hypothetical protein